MSDSSNQGITGVGSITAQNIAVGENSKIVAIDPTSTISQASWSEQLRQPLTDLQGAIESFQGPSTTRETLMAAHTEIAEELAAPAPDGSKLLAKLASMSRLAGPATTVVQAAAVLAQAIIPLL